MKKKKKLIINIKIILIIIILIIIIIIIIIKKNKLKCEWCKRDSHKEENCWRKYPKKAPSWFQKRIEADKERMQERKRKFKEMSEEEIECTYCRKVGHVERSCWRKTPSLTPAFVKRKYKNKKK